jgi:hypothetical protein
VLPQVGEEAMVWSRGERGMQYKSCQERDNEQRQGHGSNNQMNFVLTSIDEMEEDVVAAVVADAIAVVLTAEEEGRGGSSSRKALLLAARTRSSTKAAERSLGRGGCCM